MRRLRKTMIYILDSTSEIKVMCDPIPYKVIVDYSPKDLYGEENELFFKLLQSILDRKIISNADSDFKKLIYEFIRTESPLYGDLAVSSFLDNYAKEIYFYVSSVNHYLTPTMLYFGCQVYRHHIVLLFGEL